jgi:hypothetical protein
MTEPNYRKPGIRMQDSAAARHEVARWFGNVAAMASGSDALRDESFYQAYGRIEASACLRRLVMRDRH